MLKEADLNNFTGTEHHYLHQLSGFKYTDGVQFVAEQGKAYWLLDKILITMRHEKKFQKTEYQEFTVWKLQVQPDKSALLIAEDGNDNKLFEEKINWTNFPLPKIDLWFEQGCLILPSEH